MTHHTIFPRSGYASRPMNVLDEGDLLFPSDEGLLIHHTMEDDNKTVLIFRQGVHDGIQRAPSPGFSTPLA